MNTHPKTDECIKMLCNAQLAITPLLYDGISNFDKGRTNKIINFQNRIIAMLNYRLMPSCVITIPDNADIETARENRLLQDIRDFEAFWYAMKNYPLVTVNDLENEFWSICPDLGSLNKFLDVMLVKFDDVNYNYDTDIDTIKKQYRVLNKCVETGIISEEEVNTMFWNIHFIAVEYNLKMEIIRKVYKTFRKMANHQQTKEKNLVQPPQLTKELTPEQIENLKKYFISGFRGIGNNYNNFDEFFIPELTKYINSKSNKELARIAFIIYECKYFNQYPKNISYNKWLFIFYDIMGIKEGTQYKPNQHKRDKILNEMKNDFNFLF
jgi:hypothetical protein